MNQKALFIFIIIVIGAGGYIFFINSKNQSVFPVPSSEQLTINSGMPIPNTYTDEKISIEENDTRYIPYSYAAFMATSHKKRILYFHAEWCPVCRPLDLELTQYMDTIPPDAVIFKVNYDKESELKKQYTITYQHTFIQVDENGNEIARWSSSTLADIVANIK